MQRDRVIRAQDLPPSGSVGHAPAPAGDGSAADHDMAAADAIRYRLREQGVVPIEPDARIGVLLAAGEGLVAVRRDVPLERRRRRRTGDQVLLGDLYVTTARLVYMGSVTVEYPLAGVREAVVVAGALRLVVDGTQGLEIGVPDPRALRVEIGAVREAARTSAARASAAG